MESTKTIDDDGSCCFIEEEHSTQSLNFALEINLEEETSCNPNEMHNPESSNGQSDVAEAQDAIANGTLSAETNTQTDTIAVGEIVRDNPEDQFDDGGEVWHFAQATAVEPEVILFAVPADSETHQWFRDKYVRGGVLGSFCLFITIILGLAGTMLRSMMINDEGKATKELLKNCLLHPQSIDCQPDNDVQPHSDDTPDFLLSTVFELSEESSFRKRNSPQNLALRFVLDDYDRFEDEELRDRYVLAVLYFSLGGDDWLSAEKWLTQYSICDWEYIKCKNNTPAEILIGDRNLRGVIPHEISASQTIEKLSLINNHISGTIPPSIANMKNLELLNLNDNAISGSMPHFSSNLRLKELSLDYNHITGTLPDSIGNATNLRKLSLTDNKLSGTIPESIINLKALKYLGLSENHMKGTLPFEIGYLLKLEKLILRNNKISGSVPSSMSSLQNLRVLSLQSNELTGTISKILGEIYKLENLDLTNTMLMGSIPNELCNHNLNKFQKIHVECANIMCTCCSQCR